MGLLLLLLTCVAKGSGLEPVPVRFQRVPGEFSYCLGLVKYGPTWVALSQDSLLWGFGTEDAPSQLRPPNGGELRALAVHPKGLVVAGLGFCYLYADGRWTSLNLDDHFWSATTVGRDVLLGGMGGVYRIDASGVASKLLPFSSGTAPITFSANGRFYIYDRVSGLYRWNGTRMEQASDDLPWLRGFAVQSVEQQPDGSLLVCSARTVRLINGADTKVLVQGPTRDYPNRFKYATLFGDVLVVAKAVEGISGYSAKDGSLLWQIPGSFFSGRIYYASREPDGLVIGDAHAVYLLPDPSRFTFQSLPDGDVMTCSKIGDTSVLVLTSGCYDLHTGALLFPQGVESVIELFPGHIAQGKVGAVVFDGSEVQIGGSDVQQLAKVDANTVMSLQPHGLTLVSRDRSITRIATPNSVNSIATTSHGEVLAGSVNGGYVLTAAGTLRKTFGVGLTRTSKFRDGAIAYDSTGTVFDDRGERLGQFPFHGSWDVWDIIDCKGQPYLFARDEAGVRWVGAFDLKTFAWQPLDLPLYPVPTGIADDNGQLVVIGPGTRLTVREPSPLSEPDLRAVGLTGSFRPAGPSEASHVLPASSDTVTVQLPAPRLHPWRNPTYTIQLNGAAFESAPPGAIVRVPRLPWGQSQLTVRADWAGLASANTFAVYRERPWWLRAPAIVLYLGLATLAGYGVVRWRTAQLSRRARILQDMVEERTAELKKAQRAREDFFSTLSHEIRNPLNGVVGICEILEEATPSAIAPRERVFVRTLRACADQLRSILDDVLDFARIDRGAIQIHEEPFELVSAVDGAVRATDAQLSRCTLRLPDGPVWVRGDAGKVRQIVTNLTSNALKYGVPPEAKIQLALAEQAPGTITARISVVNTGPTIPAEELDAIFKGFVRGTDAVKRQISGTGIGLAVSRRIAEAMGGSLGATSLNGLTEFRLELRMPVAAAPMELESLSPFEANSRALAIEDEQYNRLVLGHILGRMGYEVDWAADGATALERVRSGSYDLILTDFMLPDTNGVDLAKRMIAELKDPKPPIVAVTAYSTPEKIQQAREAGIVGFVTKPISKKKLEAAILGIGPKYRMRQAMDAEPAQNCDFSSLLRLPNGRQILAQYADELPGAWSKIAAALATGSWESNSEPLARTVHAFRSRILAVHANDAAEQLSLLEEAVRNQDRETVDRLTAVLGPAMVDITEAARVKATATP